MTMATTIPIAFSMDMGDGSEVINKANATRKALELDAAIRGAEVDRLMAQVRLGVLALGCIRHFRIPSKAKCAEMMCLHPKRIERATALAARLIDEKGNIDHAKLDGIRSDDGSLPCVHTAEKRLGMHAEHRPRSGTPNKARQACRTSGVDTRDGGVPAGSALGQARTQWRRESDADTEQSGFISLSPPNPGRPEAGAPGIGGGSPGRASTHGPGAVAPPQPPEGPAGRASAGRLAPGRHAGSLGEQAPRGAGTPGGEQLTMDALYLGAMSEAERLIAALGELAEKDGLDAALVMGAGEHFGLGLEMLRAAGKGTNANTAHRGKDPHGVLPSGTTGAG